jgi:hypothetical protein
MPLEEVLAAWEEPVTLVEVPADSWITDRFTLPADVVVGPSRPVRLGWADERGRLVERPSPALYQHVFGPGIPAFAARTPRSPGEYRLVFLDDQSRPIRSRPYRVRRDLQTIVGQTGHRKDAVDAGKFVATKVVRDGGTPRVILENMSTFYLQANTSRDQVYLKSARNHVGTMRTSAGSLVLRLWTSSREASHRDGQSPMLLPCDLPPGGRIEISLRSIDTSVNEPLASVDLMPQFLRRGEPVGGEPAHAARVAHGLASPRR